MRVLVLAYHFPPLGGAGVQNTLKLVRYLPELGWRPFVVTGSGHPRGRWAPVDRSMEAEVPELVAIERITTPEPPPPSGWCDRADRWLMLRSDWDRWWTDGAVETARRVDEVDVVFASMLPYSTMAAAARIGAERGVPVVASLRDPWALDEMLVFPSGLHRRRELTRMRRDLRAAAAIVMNTPEAARRLVETFGELRDRAVVSVTNGFDAADFATPAPPPRGDGRFRIVHTGYLHTEDGLHQRRTARLRRIVGGSVPGVDILARSHVFLLEAVERLIGTHPELEGTLEVCFAGVLSDTDKHLINDLPVARELGYVSHAQSIELLRSAELLFLPMQALPPGRRATVVPGKTYEYLGSGTPILAAVPEGDARDFLREAGNAYLCDPDDVSAIASAILAAVEQWREGRRADPPSGDFLARFERRRLAQRVAGVLGDVVAAWAD